jgi:hypothetical protein
VANLAAAIPGDVYPQELAAAAIPGDVYPQELALITWNRAGLSARDILRSRDESDLHMKYSSVSI